MVAVVLLALAGTILQRLCCEIHAVAILVSVSQICGLIAPTSSWSPFSALLERLCPFAFRQSNLVCTAGTPLQCKQRQVSGVNGESSFKSDSWAEPTHCHRLSCSSAWWMSGTSALRAELRLLYKTFLGQVFFSFAHSWVHKNITDGGEDSGTANASLLTKSLLLPFASFADSSEVPPLPRRPQLRTTGFSLLDQVCEQQSSVRFGGSRIIHTLKY